METMTIEAKSLVGLGRAINAGYLDSFKLQHKPKGPIQFGFTHDEHDNKVEIYSVCMFREYGDGHQTFLVD